MMLKTILVAGFVAMLAYNGGDAVRVRYQPWQLEEMLREIEQRQQRDSEAKQESQENGNIWVVLVAGSNEWYNYRHQADICHAYQVVKNHGVAASNIITMMYDDIAQNSQNPRKGVIINKPGGSDVYGGVVIDYKAEDVTPENFLKVLTGDATLKAAGKKVLGSGPNDRVFVFFSDHGATGLIAFPNDVLHAGDLSHALITMHQKNMYKEMTFYLEACESGSMFNSGLLPPSLKIYALTASNAEESSYACYLDDDLNTYLGDCFSVAWMEDSDTHDIQQETLQVQYLRVKSITTLSHVMQYGDLSFTSEMVGEFQGTQNPSASLDMENFKRQRHAVAQEDVELTILSNLHRRANSAEEQEKHAKAIREHILLREKTAALFERILTVLHGGSNAFLESIKNRRGGYVNFQCYAPVLKYFSSVCMPLHANSPALNHLYKLASLCQLGSAPERIMQAMRVACA
jgi:legumain